MSALSAFVDRVRETLKPGPSQELADLHAATARVTASAVALEKSAAKLGCIVRDQKRGPNPRRNGRKDAAQ